MDVIDPSSERTITQVAEGTVEDTDTAVAAAVAAAPRWGRLTPKERSELLHRAADRLAEHADLLARLESVNTGKPSAVAQDDIAQTVDTFRFMAGALRATTSAAAGRYAEDHLSVILREPLGVVGVVTPWNYPLLMAAWKMAPILAAGNTLVIKPSEQTPLTTLKFGELVADILPAGVVNVVTGYGPVVGARLAEHPDVAMIALTGSVRSGQAGGPRRGRVAQARPPGAGRQGPGGHLPGRRPGGRRVRGAHRRLLELGPGVRCRVPRAGPRVGGRPVRRAPRRRGRHDGRRRACCR
nr:aldehyde dehydrogenase family protein [Pseudonocardia nigra]